MSTFKPHTNTHTVQYILRFSHSIFSLCVARGWGILPKLLGGGVILRFSHSIFSVCGPGVGDTPQTFGWGCAARSSNPDPISDQTILFFRPLFRPDPENLK